MEYPRTDDDWENLAECIVTKMPDVSPEVVGGYTVDATATIFSWYKGDERRKALDKRQYARVRLIGWAKEAGCVPELMREEIELGEEMMEVPIGEEAHYWEVTNMVRGEIMQESISYRTIAEAVSEAQFVMNTKYAHFGDEHLVIKIFDKHPGERAGLTLEPEYTESYWREGPAKDAQEVLGRISEPLDRPFPKTYGDWVDLGMSIKEKAGISDFETTTLVNRHLINIYDEEQDPGIAQESKRWLTNKAGELGIT